MKFNSFACTTLLALGCSAASAGPLLTNAVAIDPISVVTTSNWGGIYIADNTINQAGLSSNYISGITAASAINSITHDNVHVWHGAEDQRTGSLTFDLGTKYTLDRVFLFWANYGHPFSNNIADIYIEVSNDPLLATFTTAATFSRPTGPLNEVDFASTVTGEYVRLRWTSIDGIIPGLGEFVAGGIAPIADPGGVAPIPEPETYAMMLAGLGLLGVVARRRKQKLST